jgi:phosphoglycerol transferase MdoB-like AlkP superfamily enzyme
METVLAICLGLGLSAACGFRVFVPLLGINVAALAGHVVLAEGFQWIGTWPAFACFLTATVLEVSAYYVPWVDNLLDTIATPAAVVAGTMATASVVTDMSPLLRWTLAVIAGGGLAAVVQTGTVTWRILRSRPENSYSPPG